MDHPSVDVRTRGCHLFESESQDTVVGRDELGLTHLGSNRAPGAADAGIDDDDMDRVRRKVLKTRGEEQGA